MSPLVRSAGLLRQGRIEPSTEIFLKAGIAVVGARAAGSAVALQLVRQGHDVLVVDRMSIPSDTRSTGLLARSGLVQLDRWGLLEPIMASGTPPIRNVTLHVGDDVRRRQLIERSGIDFIAAPRRIVLDSIMATAAANSGARILTNVNVVGVRRESNGRVTGLDAVGLGRRPITIEAELVIGADGVRSAIGQFVGAPIVETRTDGSAMAYAYFDGNSWSDMELYLADRRYAGIFPTHGGQACVWVCIPASDARLAKRYTHHLGSVFDEIVRSIPALHQRLTGAERNGPARGVLGSVNQVRRAFGPGWALVGDALYHRDPITGHGISDAYRDAETLAAAVDSGLRGGRPLAEALADYERSAAQDRRLLFDLTCELGRFPAADHFLDLRNRFLRAIDDEAARLAARRLPTGASAVLA